MSPITTSSETSPALENSNSSGASEPGKTTTGGVTARLKILERLLASAPPAVPTSERHVGFLRFVELGIAILAGIALVGGGALGTQAWSTQTTSHPETWLLFGMGITLTVLSGGLAAGGAWWDALILRLLKRSPQTISSRDRLLTLAGAILLLCGAIFQFAIFASQSKTDAPGHADVPGANP